MVEVMKVAIYIRTSTEDQNPENQLKDCMSLYDELMGELIPYYKDQQSAWKDNKDRLAFEDLKKEIKKGNVSHLIVWDFDRIYRNRLRFKEFLLFLKAYNVSLHSFRQAWLEEIYRIPSPWNDIVSDLMINIYGHIAEDESKKKSERVKIAQRFKDGLTYSYKGNKWGRKSLSTQKVNKILDLKGKMPLRNIAAEVGCSVGVVHKVIANSETQKNVSGLVSESSQ